MEYIQKASRDIQEVRQRSQNWANPIEEYARWYEEVERLIKLLLKMIGITIDSERKPFSGSHRHHAEILERLRQPGNPYYEVLGHGKIHDFLHLAKGVRNRIMGKGPGPLGIANPDWDKWTESINIIENGLWIAIGIMINETKSEKNPDWTYEDEEIQEDMYLQEDKLDSIEQKESYSAPLNPVASEEAKNNDPTSSRMAEFEEKEIQLRNLRETCASLRHRLAAAESNQVSDEEMVVGLLSNMEGCNNASHRLLKKVFDRP